VKPEARVGQQFEVAQVLVFEKLGSDGSLRRIGPEDPPFKVGYLFEPYCGEIVSFRIPVERRIDVGARVAHHFNFSNVKRRPRRVVGLRSFPGLVIRDHWSR